MAPPAAADQPLAAEPAAIGRLRQFALAAVAVVIALVLLPPLGTVARHYEYVETIQFCLAAFAVPALVVIGRPWSRLRRGKLGRETWGALERLGEARIRHPELLRALVFAAADVGLVILWRTPAWMDALVRHPWLVALQVLSLAAVGVCLWLELLACPPLVPRLPRPWRAVVAVVSMWGVWVMAFIVGFSHVSWYPAYHHAGVTFSSGADQQVATGILWLGAVCAFVPVIFTDVMAWLRNTEDPDAELRRLIRAERRSGDG